MRKQKRNYVYKPRYGVRRLNVKNIALLITTGVVIGTTSYALSKTSKKVEVTEFMVYPNKQEESSSYEYPTTVNSQLVNDSTVTENNELVIPVEEPVQENQVTEQESAVYTEPEQIVVEEVIRTGQNGGDSVVARKNVNLRLNQGTESKKLGQLPEGATADRILSYGAWNLIRYNGQISFVSSDYVTTSQVDYNNEYYNVEPYKDIVRTNSALHFRLGPSTNEGDLGLLDKDEELIVIGKSVSYNDPNDIWYVVRARGQIGFVKASYTKSLKEEVQRLNPALSEIEIIKLGYLNEDAALRDAPNGNVIAYSEQYQLVQVLQTNGNYYLVNIDGQIGYVNKNAVKSVEDKFRVVDISNQRIYLYSNKDITYVGKCTTGKNSTPTELGYFTPYAKGESHDFPDGHSCRILWEPFNGGQGLHDAPWEKDKDFGDSKYRGSHGSAGCVRLPDDVAEYIKENTTTSQKILIKK